MAGKPLNKKNLVVLGAETLADLLLVAVKGDAARQRRVRMALATDQGPREAAADVRKRFARIRKARSFLSWKTERTLARELTDLMDAIDQRVAPEDATTAFDLLWVLLHLAPGIHARTDDSNGPIGAVMDEAMDAFSRLAPRLDVDAQGLADTVFDGIMDDGYGAFDHAVTALGEALGETGLAHLKARAEAAIAAPLTEVDLARYDDVGDERRRADQARDNRDRTAQIILQDVADLQGDVDAWLARYTAEQLTFHTIAPQAAQRLMVAGRPGDALRIVRNSLVRQEAEDRWFDTPDLDAAHFDCLEALRDEDALRAAR